MTFPFSFKYLPLKRYSQNHINNFAPAILAVSESDADKRSKPVILHQVSPIKFRILRIASLNAPNRWHRNDRFKTRAFDTQHQLSASNLYLSATGFSHCCAAFTTQ